MMDFNIVYVKALHSVNGPKSQPGVPLSNQLAVAAHIAMRYVDWSSGDGAWPSVATLASALGMSPKTTGNAISALEKQGWLNIEVRRNRPSIYRLTIPKVTQPLLTDVDSTPQNLPTDVTVTAQNLPTHVNLDSSDVTFAVGDVTVTDDLLYEPIKNLVVDASEGDDAPTTTQQNEEGEVAPPDDLCPDGLTQWMLDAFEQYGFPLGIASATSLMVQLRGYGLTLRQIQAYITERLIDAEMHDKTPRASYLIGDAPAWLKARQPLQPHPEDVERERKRREDQEYLWESARQAREEAEARTPEEQAAKEIYYKQLAHQFWGSHDEIN